MKIYLNIDTNEINGLRFAIVKKIIQGESESMINLYKTSLEKDDLSDRYLQGIYYLEL